MLKKHKLLFVKKIVLTLFGLKRSEEARQFY